jgi:hypothetical protein
MLSRKGDDNPPLAAAAINRWFMGRMLDNAHVYPGGNTIFCETIISQVATANRALSNTSRTLYFPNSRFHPQTGHMYVAFIAIDVIHSRRTIAGHSGILSKCLPGQLQLCLSPSCVPL